MPGSELTVEQIREVAAGQLSKFKIPKYVEFTTALPRNANGKILKRSLRKQWLDNLAATK
jgi:fatty-acyl-CoA synthase